MSIKVSHICPLLPFSEWTFFFLLFFVLCLLRRIIPIYLCLYTNNFPSKLLTTSVYFCLGLFFWLLGIWTVSLRSSPFYTSLALQLDSRSMLIIFLQQAMRLDYCLPDFYSSLACVWSVILLHYYPGIQWLILSYLLPPSFSLGKNIGKHVITIFLWVLRGVHPYGAGRRAVWTITMCIDRDYSWTFLISKHVSCLLTGQYNSAF